VVVDEELKKAAYLGLIWLFYDPDSQEYATIRKLPQGA